MKHRVFAGFVVSTTVMTLSASEPIHVAFLWHMHQPIYWPYESPVQIDANARFSYSVVDIHNQRFGPYTTWPRDSIQTGLSLPHLGAQVSFTGALIENLNSIRNAGVNGGMWNGWDAAYDQSRGWLTALGNRRMDLVAFGYHHPLMPLLDEQDIRMQIRLHKHVYAQAWSGGGDYSRGMFPPETAFSTRIIPALVAEGVEWVMVDNIHFDRACMNYPHTNASNLYAPNRADQINSDPAASGGAWIQLNNLWAPSRVSAPFGYQPHYAQHIDPQTGAATRMVVVPAARYEGNEDGRGGYGAFLYSTVMDQYAQYNTDPDRPMLVLLHHDGDNYGGGTEAYYHSNWQNMVNWASADPDYDVTTIDDYLERFPVPAGAIIHVENGSWAGADNGDPEFKKWLGDPNGAGVSPDRNSWAVLTAAKNWVFTAEEIAPAPSLQNILTGSGSNTEKAWHWLLCSQASDYWYWDFSQNPWDSNVTRGSNQAVAFAQQVANITNDQTPPTVFLPQREPYNPGSFEFGGQPEPRDFEVWTFAYDISGISGITLRWRIDLDGLNPLNSIQNETYAGGGEVAAWQSIAMTPSNVPTPPGALASTFKAQRFSASITGQYDVLIDYFVEAIDNGGRVQRTDIQHVYVGTGEGGGGSNAVSVVPDPPVASQAVTISYNPAGRPLAGSAAVYLHYGFNQWNPVVSPDPVMTWDEGQSRWFVTVPVLATANQLDLAFTNGAGTWDNNGAADWHFSVQGGQTPEWQMNGVLDAGACSSSSAPVCLLAQNNGMSLWAGLVGDTLYVACPDAGEGNDHFIYLARTPGPLRSANWAKAGQIADWNAFLADENNNDFESWFDAVGTRQAATGANGGVLEGTINLREEFGLAPGQALPSTIYLAVGVYASADGGALRWQSQVPASVNQDGNIDASEYLAVAVTAIGGASDCPADIDADGSVGLGDLATLLSNFGTPSGATGDDGDLSGDGAVDLEDLASLLSAFGSTCD